MILIVFTVSCSGTVVGTKDNAVYFTVEFHEEGNPDIYKEVKVKLNDVIPDIEPPEKPFYKFWCWETILVKFCQKVEIHILIDFFIKSGIFIKRKAPQ